MTQEDFPLFYGMINAPLPKPVPELLDFASYLAALQVARPALTEAQLKPQFDAADTEDPTGSLNFNEFKVAVAADKAALKLTEDLKDPNFAAHYAMDADRDGKLTLTEYKTAALATNPTTKEETLKEEFDASDADGDQSLTLEEHKVLQVKIKERAALELRIATDAVFAEFYKLDTDKNLELTFDELKVQYPQIDEAKLKKEYDQADTASGAAPPMTYEEYVVFLGLRKAAAELEAKLAADPALRAFYDMQTAEPYDFKVSLAEYLASAKVAEPAATDEELTARFNAVDTAAAGEIDFEAYTKLQADKLAADVAAGNAL